jgi:S1-C subfamily serine protease
MSYSSPFAPRTEPGSTAETVTTAAVTSPPRARPRTIALAALAVALLVVAGGACGAAITHEFWTTASVVPPSSVATTPPATATPSPVAPGGGAGSFGGQGVPSLTPNGRGGFTINAGGFSVTVGPDGIHFGNTGSGNGGSGASSVRGPANAAAIAAKVAPALVNINTTYSYARGAGAGTGIVISPDGEVLTNNHVIDGATRITATDVGNGKTYAVTVVGYDPGHDVAVLQLQGASGLATATLGNSSQVSVGDRIVGLGNAGGAGGTPSTAGGVVTGLNESITAGDMLGGKSERLSGLIETNAAVEPGDSGGPLVDGKGHVIGMITAGAASVGLGLGLGLQPSTARALAVPINVTEQIASQITSGRESATAHIGPTAFLGVSVAASGVSGLRVAGVVSGEAAEKAGLSVGDTITAVDGHAISSSSELSRSMLRHHPGDTIELNWSNSSGQSRAASVRLGSGPPA